MSTPPRVRICLFGLGPAGRHLHLPALRRIEAADVVAVCDPDEGTHALAGTTRVVGDWQAALAEPFDAAVIATPPHTHFALASAVLAAGKHVYVEKPMTTSLAEAVELDRLAAKSAGIVQVGFAYRFHPLWRRVRRLVDAGALRPPLRAHGLFTTERGGSGWLDPVVDLASHHIDLIAWLVGTPPNTLSATPDGDLTVHWLDGASLVGRYVVGPPADHIQLAANGANVVVDRLHGTRLKGRGLRLGRAAWPDRGLVRAHVSRSGWERSFEFALRAFVAAAERGDHHAPGPREGLRAVAAAEATMRSLESGRPESIAVDGGLT